MRCPVLENRQMLYFLAVAREGSVTAAARSLHISQPALSKQMQELERQLGQPLFDRGRGMALTDAGRMLRRRAAEMVELAEHTELALSGGAEVSGEVRVGCGESAGFSVLARAMAQVRTEHPQVAFRIFSGDADAVCERIDRGLLDIGLLLGGGFDERYDAVSIAADERFCLAVPSGDESDLRGCAMPADARRLPLILPSQGEGHGFIAGWAGVPEKDLTVVARYNLVSNAMELQRAGLGCVLGLEGPMRPLVPQGCSLVPLEGGPTVAHHVINKRHQELTAAVRAVLEALQAAE